MTNSFKGFGVAAAVAVMLSGCGTSGLGILGSTAGAAAGSAAGAQIGGGSGQLLASQVGASLGGGLGGAGTGLLTGGTDDAAIVAASAGTTSAAVAGDPAVVAAQQQALQNAITQQMAREAILQALVPSTDAQITGMQAAIRQAILSTALQQYRAGPVATVASSPVPASVVTATPPSVFAPASYDAPVSAPLVYIDEVPAAAAAPAAPVVTTYSAAPAAAPVAAAPVTTYATTPATIGFGGVSVTAPTLTIQ